MALAHPTGFDLEGMRREVRKTYEQVACDPEGIYHFHCGLDYAVETLGYPRAALEALPERATASFSGVANPHAIRPLPEGGVVLDVGSGSGTYLLLAAGAVGADGRVIGVDATPEMRASARASADVSGMGDRVDIRPGLAEDLPVGDRAVDAVITNGVLNLVADKVRAFSEVKRVLRPGGLLQLGDVLLVADLHEHERMDPHLWAA